MIAIEIDPKIDQKYIISGAFRGASGARLSVSASKTLATNPKAVNAAIAPQTTPSGRFRCSRFRTNRNHSPIANKAAGPTQNRPPRNANGEPSPASDSVIAVRQKRVIATAATKLVRKNASRCGSVGVEGTT